MQAIHAINHSWLFCMSYSVACRYAGRLPAACATYPTPSEAHEPGDSGWHYIYEGQQEHTIDCPRSGFRNLIGEIRYELDEQCTIECAGDRCDATDDEADQKINRQPCRKTVGCHKLHHYRT